MKNILVLLISCLIVSGSLWSQEITDLEFVSPFHEGFAAVKKGGQWGFIDANGTLVVDFRSDLVMPSEMEAPCCLEDRDIDYPIFKSQRCLIKIMKDGITHFGFIDPKGNTVIKPEYLNASQFHGNHAIVVKVYKESLGRNEILGKNVIAYRYNEEVIDVAGTPKFHLRGPFNLIYSKEELRKPPQLLSRFLSSEVVAITTPKDLWKIKVLQ